LGEDEFLGLRERASLAGTITLNSAKDGLEQQGLPLSGQVDENSAPALEACKAEFLIPNRIAEVFRERL